MPEVRTPQSTLRFDGFELDLRSGELRRERGSIVRLTEQPFRILVLLLQHPQEVVTCKEIRKQLWPNDTIVEFEHSISAAMKGAHQIAAADVSPAIPERSYRFIAPVNWAQQSEPIQKAGKYHKRRVYLSLLSGLIVFLAVSIARWRSSLRLPVEATKQGDLEQGSPTSKGSGPVGTYLDSCTDSIVRGKILTAVCQKQDGTWQTATLQDFSQCDGDIWNVDGYLSCDLKRYSPDIPDSDLDPTHFYAHLTLAEKLEQNGAYEPAVAEYKQALDVSNHLQGTCGRLWLAHAYVRAHDLSHARKTIKEAMTRSPKEEPSYCLAQAYAGLDNEEALRWLDRAYQERDPRIYFIESDWRLSPLRSNPKFGEIVWLGGVRH